MMASTTRSVPSIATTKTTTVRGRGTTTRTTRTTTTTTTRARAVVEDAADEDAQRRFSLLDRTTALAAMTAVSTTLMTATMTTERAEAYVPGFFAGAANAAPAKSALAGKYADKKHPGCYREIFADGTVKGEDGDPGCGARTVTRAWTLAGVIDVNDDSIFIDFSPKGGPANFLGVRVDEGVKFPDGNVWRKLD